MDELDREGANLGVVKISDEVVSVIAGIAAGEISGVADGSQVTSSGITQILTGKKNTTKGVKVSVEEGLATIDLHLSVYYGVRIPEIVFQVQENVKRTVESMTGLEVSSVNIFIQNIVVPKSDEKTID